MRVFSSLPSKTSPYIISDLVTTVTIIVIGSASPHYQRLNSLFEDSFDTYNAKVIALLFKLID